jgi:hypothetical protein
MQYVKSLVFNIKELFVKTFLIAAIIIKEITTEAAKPAAPVKKKEADEFKEKPAAW